MYIYIYIYGMFNENPHTHTCPKTFENLVFAIYGRMAGSDAWNMFLWIFQDLTVDILKSLYF